MAESNILSTNTVSQDKIIIHYDPTKNISNEANSIELFNSQGVKVDSDVYLQGYSGPVYNSDGIRVFPNGSPVLFNAEGNRINSEGYKVVDAPGTRSDGMSRPFVNESPSSEFYNSEGVRVTNEGKTIFYNSEGQMIDSEGYRLNSNGKRLVADNWENVPTKEFYNSKGERVTIQGKPWTVDNPPKPLTVTEPKTDPTTFFDPQKINPFLTSPHYHNPSGGGSYGGSSDMMSFDGVTEGIDTAAMGRYLDALKLDLLDKVSEEIENVDDIVKVINENWQGKSRDAFLKNFAEQRSRIISDLNEEYQDLMNRFIEIQAFYFKADELMMD